MFKKKLYDNVVADLVSQAKKIKQGNGLLADTEMGPLISKTAAKPRCQLY
ncbi:aldehyde dehydrogenase family protein [Terrilactibacillus sp. S3-3]|nr:aldehyde dehydrogenase family protein [Terrilactibacillus sp. S3-3]